MPAKPAPASTKGKPVPQVNNTDRFNLNELRTEDKVNAQIEAKTRAHELSKFVALVTGGANGLGREICRAFAAEGTKVAILDKDKLKGEELANELSKKHGKAAGMFFQCNLVDSKSFETAVKAAKTQMGRFDILVNNAACFADSLDKFEDSISLNFKSVINASLMAVTDMGAKTGGNGGLVINVADTLALIPSHLTPIYSATKAAVIKFTVDMGQTQLLNMTKVGFLVVVPNAFKGGRIFDDPKDKVLIPGRDMLDNFSQTFNSSKIHQTPEHVAQNIVQIVKSGARTGVFLIENGEPFKKVELPNPTTNTWLPEKL